MTDTFNMQYVASVVRKWMRPIVAFVLLATVAGALATLTLPRKYLSVATIVPADPSLNDKSFLYGTQVLELKSVYGKEEDLDRLVAAALLDGHLNFLADSFRLAEHYKIGGSPEKARNKSFRQLKKNRNIFKTENGTVKIQVWDTDKKRAAELANALVQRTEQVLSENNKKANTAFLKQLELSIARKTKQYLEPAVPGTFSAAERELKELERKNLLSDIESERKTHGQLVNFMEAGNPALVVLEKAYPADLPDKPRPWLWIGASFFASIIFAILLALLAEQLKKRR